MKKILFIVIILALSAMIMSSCAVVSPLMGEYAGYGYYSQRGGKINRALEDNSRCWTSNGAIITPTSQKNLYQVIYRGICDDYYLMPQAQALKSIPAEYEAYYGKPNWNDFYKELSWMFWTKGPNRNIEVLNNGNIIRRN